MFKVLAIISFIVGFTVPYISAESVEVWQMILMQIVLYGVGVWNLLEDKNQ